MPSSVPIIAKGQLEAMHTGSLLSRLRRLQQCEESFAASDRYGEEGEPRPSDTGHIEFKDTAEWRTAFSDLKELLSSRERLLSAAERKAKRDARGR